MSVEIKKCEACGYQTFKYKCPACHYRSCSLECVKKHKIELGCTGVRNRVKLIEKSDMDNFTLLSDYRFLEEIDHKLEDGFRNPIRRFTKQKNSDFKELPEHMKKMKIETRRRGTELQYLPGGFSKRLENTSKYFYRANKISWRVKWVFPHADVTYTDERIDENVLIVDTLRKFMEPKNRLDSFKGDLISQDISQKLEYYQSASYNRIAALLKTELPTENVEFIELFLSRSFKDNFINKTIVEFPVIYIVFKDHLDAFIDRDRNFDLIEKQSVFDGNKFGTSRVVARDPPKVKKPTQLLSSEIVQKNKLGYLGTSYSSDSDSE